VVSGLSTVELTMLLGKAERVKTIDESKSVGTGKDI
jgi:hypothetical protein